MTANTEKQTLSFQAEVKQLLHLVTHSLYSNKEIFLRELISNASDAADKLRFEGLKDPKLYENDSELKIWVEFDKEARTITIRDNGIGMTRDEAIEHLGTIAKSGTKDFLQSLTGDQSKDSRLIGQFGVGFYSAFVVADKVIVKTRHAGLPADQGVQWESTGEGDYIVHAINKPTRGTEVILHLKKDEDEFLDAYRLRNIITKYSDHIVLPIIMQKEKEDLPDTSTDDKEKNEAVKTEEAAAPQEEVVNRAKALWAMPKSYIKEEEYKELYKHISHDFQDPLTWSHNKIEGNLQYTLLLYLPAMAPWDLFNRDRRQGLKLYVQRVFIMDDAEQLLPMYLRFVKGIVDSNDLPLNVSREILQSNKTIETIRAAVIKRVLGMLDEMATKEPEKYKKFWQQFGSVIKEGLAEDYANREAIAKLLRFSSTQSNNEEENVSLADYVSRMKPEQQKIYYVIADNFMAAKNSPHLEIFRKQGIEVLLMHDRIDEWVVAHLTEFEGKQLQSVTKGDLDDAVLSTEKDEQKDKAVKDEFENVIKQMQTALGEKVKEIRVTHRLTDSPACLVADANDLSAHMQRLMEQMGQKMPGAKPIMEINPTHPIVLKLKDEQDDTRFAEWSEILFDQALLAEGGKLEDPATFVKRLNSLMLQLAR
jgi:molecular chaperone HtpG